MMDTTWIRLGAQIALVAWCMAEALVLLASRGKWTPVTGVRYALVGLACFAGWMFLSALTIRSIQLFPRENLLWVFAALEAGTAAAAWAWLVVSVHNSFSFSFRRSHNGA